MVIYYIVIACSSCGIHQWILQRLWRETKCSCSKKKSSRWSMFVPKASYLTAFQVHLWRVCAKVLARSVPLCIIHVWPMCNVKYRNVKNWLATVKTVVAAFLTLQFLWHIELPFSSSWQVQSLETPVYKFEVSSGKSYVVWHLVQ